MQYWSAIDRISKGLAYMHVFENGVAQIERQILQARSRLLDDLEIGFVTERADDVRRQGSDSNVSAAFAQLQRSCGRIRHNVEAQPLHPGVLAPIAVIAFQDDLAVRRETHKPERPRSNGCAIEVLIAPVGHY